MKIIDFFHFPTSIKDENNLLQLKANEIKNYISNIKNNNDTKYVFPIFSSKVIKEYQFCKLLENKRNTNNFYYLYMPDFNKNIKNQISLIKKIGFIGIVIHPYIQNIDNRLYDKLDTLINACENKKLFISVCAAYGSSKMYKYYPLKIVSHIAERFSREIIIIHGGGLKIMESLLLAESYKNIYLETSFSLNYWSESSLIADYAYVFKKIGSKRIIFGSDNPFMPYSESKNFLKNLLKKNKFTNSQINNIFFNNANNLLLKYE